jgi:hypothetical protein
MSVEAEGGSSSEHVTFPEPLVPEQRRAPGERWTEDRQVLAAALEAQPDSSIHDGDALIHDGVHEMTVETPSHGPVVVDDFNSSLHVDHDPTKPPESITTLRQEGRSILQFRYHRPGSESEAGAEASLVVYRQGEMDPEKGMMGAMYAEAAGPDHQPGELVALGSDGQTGLHAVDLYNDPYLSSLVAEVVEQAHPKEAA